MKKLFLLAVAAILFTNMLYAQAGWVNYKIDKKLSVKLPEQPKDVQGNLFAKDKDSVIYVITVVDFVKVAGIDSAALAPLAPTQDFANGIRTGMTSQLPGFTMGDIKIGTWHGLVSYNIDGISAEKKVKTYSFMVISGSLYYSLSTIVPDGKHTTATDDFFKSLTLN